MIIFLSLPFSLSSCELNVSAHEPLFIQQIRSLKSCMWIYFLLSIYIYIYIYVASQWKCKWMSLIEIISAFLEIYYLVRETKYKYEDKDNHCSRIAIGREFTLGATCWKHHLGAGEPVEHWWVWWQLNGEEGGEVSAGGTMWTKLRS